MKTTKTFLKNIIATRLPISHFFDKILIISNFNNITSSINRNKPLTLLILITLLTTIMIRLDSVIPILKDNLPYELELSLRLTSALYSIISIFLIIISVKSFLELTAKKKIIQIDNKTYYLYFFYYVLFYI